jgi:hypothetical protein
MGLMAVKKNKAPKKKARKAKPGDKIARKSRTGRGVPDVNLRIDIGPPNSRETW